jgi:hypothetical protein
MLWLAPRLALAAVLSVGVARPQAPGSGRDWLVHPIAAPAEVRVAGDCLVLENGLIRRTIQIRPDAATVAFDDLRTGASLLRGVKPEAEVVIDGRTWKVGGLLGQPDYAYLTDAWRAALRQDPTALHYVGHAIGAPVERFPWARVRHAAPSPWPPAGVALRLDFAHDELSGRVVSVHYELYAGLPVLSKWLSVRNAGAQPCDVDGFCAEVLAVVEHEADVEAKFMSPPQTLHVETDYAFGGFTARTSAYTVAWEPDPDYATQVNYERVTPCLLRVRPPVGPDQTLAPGATFTSFRVFELVHDSTDRERRGLALRRMYRALAPWVTENPLMMHMRTADPAAVRVALDQCADVGFEMLILSFGSGFDVEDRSPANLARWQEIAAYAKAKGIEIGGYSLLASRCIDVATGKPGGGKFGFAPALASAWGQRYFETLRAFYAHTGFSLLEHDGSYPGDFDAVARPPLQKGHADSQWVQWRIVTEFYQWCRARGIYLNVPDYYYLAGSNKCGMGYRETNWSLPRAQQHVHARQNMFDGTWEKTPSMGWMFVPLTEYHGGGAEATLEPLAQHLDDYRSHMQAALGFGVQACYRGPRLYDGDVTRAMVKGMVDWFKRYRAILESDVIHGRRADGRDVDWVVHVNPQASPRAMLVAFNPLDAPLERTLRVDLYYSGATDRVQVRPEGGTAREYALARDFSIRLPVTLPARGMRWFAIE